MPPCAIPLHHGYQNSLMYWFTAGFLAAFTSSTHQVTALRAVIAHSDMDINLSWNWSVPGMLFTWPSRKKFIYSHVQNWFEFALHIFSIRSNTYHSNGKDWSANKATHLRLPQELAQELGNNLQLIDMSGPFSSKSPKGLNQTRQGPIHRNMCSL